MAQTYDPQVRCVCGVSWTCAAPLFIHDYGGETPPPLTFFFFEALSSVESGAECSKNIHDTHGVVTRADVLIADEVTAAVGKQGWVKLARRWRGGGGGGATLSHLPADTKMAEFSRQQLTCGTCFLCWAIMKRLKKTHKVRHAVLLPPGRGCWWSQGFSSFWSSCREGTLRDWGQFCLQVRCTFHFFHSPGLTFQIEDYKSKHF